MKNDRKTATDDNTNVKTLCVALFFFILMFSGISLAVDQYQQQGFIDSSYHTEDETLFNLEFNTLYGTPAITTKAISTNAVLQAPLFYDIDDDGINEILTSQNQNIVIFQNNTLDYQSTIVVNNTVYKYKVYEYGGNTYVLALSETGSSYNIFEYVYNAGSYDYVTHHTAGNTAFPEYSVAFVCDESTGRCLSSAEGFAERSFKLGEGSINTDIGGGGDSLGECMSRDPQIVVNDIDNDGINEFIMTKQEESSPYKFWALAVELNSSTEIIYDHEDVLLSGLPSGITNNCDIWSKYFTSPLIADIIRYQDDDNFVFARATSSNGFKLYSYYFSGGSFNAYDDHPETYSAEGQIISNPFLCKIFTDYSGINDYCVLGYTDNNATDLLVASDKTGNAVQTREFKTENFTNYFIPAYNTNQHIVHSIQADDDLQDSIDYSEILTPFGIYQPRYATCNILNFAFGIPCELRRIYPLSYADGIASPGYSDPDSVPYFDLVYTTATNIYYIDDKYVNQNAIIDEYTTNPCLTSQWKQNTSVQLTITPFDRENDPVRARVILYYDSDHAMDSNWSSFASEGTEFPFSFTANTTITSGKILLMAQDNLSEHNETFDSILLSFSVGNDGVSFGDCSTSVTGLVAESLAEEQEAITGGDNYTNTDNIIKDAFDTYAEMSHVPVLIFFILGMIIYNFMLIMYGGHIFGENNAFLLFLIVILSDFLASILAGLMGIIGIGMLVTLLILFIIIGIFYVAKTMHRSTG